MWRQASSPPSRVNLASGVSFEEDASSSQVVQGTAADSVDTSRVTLAMAAVSLDTSRVNLATATDSLDTVGWTGLEELVHAQYHAPRSFEAVGGGGPPRPRVFEASTLVGPRQQQ